MVPFGQQFPAFMPNFFYSRGISAGPDLPITAGPAKPQPESGVEPGPRPNCFVPSSTERLGWDPRAQCKISRPERQDY